MKKIPLNDDSVLAEDNDTGKQLIKEGPALNKFSAEEKKAIENAIPRERITRTWRKRYWNQSYSEKGIDFEKVIDSFYQMSVDQFLFIVELSCELFLQWSDETQGISKHAEDIKNIEDSLRDAMRQLKRVFMGTASIPVCRKIEFPPREYMTANAARQGTAIRAFEAYNLLEKICATIDYYREPSYSRGAPGVTGPLRGLAETVVTAYHKSFCVIPTVHVSKSGGCFFDVFNEVVNAATGEKKERDHSRMLRAVIKDLRDGLLPKEHNKAIFYWDTSVAWEGYAKKFKPKNNDTNR